MQSTHIHPSIKKKPPRQEQKRIDRSVNIEEYQKERNALLILHSSIEHTSQDVILNRKKKDRF